jgi:hypothetical protein
MKPANLQKCEVANPAADIRWQIRLKSNTLSCLRYRRRFSLTKQEE